MFDILDELVPRNVLKSLAIVVKSEDAAGKKAPSYNEMVTGPPRGSGRVHIEDGSRGVCIGVVVE